MIDCFNRIIKNGMLTNRRNKIVQEHGDLNINIVNFMSLPELWLITTTKGVRIRCVVMVKIEKNISTH